MAEKEPLVDRILVRYPELADELHALQEHWRGQAAAPDGEREAERPREGRQPLTVRLSQLRVGMPDINLEEETATDGSFSNEVRERLAGRAVGFGRYKLKGEIAHGGQGAVLRVWDEDLRRHLAMKVLLGHPALAGHGTPHTDATPPIDDRTLARFLEEAQVTSQLDHPGIVPVHEVGLDDRGCVYFTMKLVRGDDLGVIFERLAAGEDDEWNRTRALGVLVKVGEAMAYSHSKGVIHRDLKPGNIMVGRFGETYVMDWGLARVLGLAEAPDSSVGMMTTRISSDRGDSDNDSPLVTRQGTVLGTPAFMAPEQAKGATFAIGPRTDVYSVGALLYQLLTGQMPYMEGKAPISYRMVLGKLLLGPPKPISSLAPDVPAELVAICEKAMEREPAQRYADMAALVDDLRAFLEQRVVQAYETGAVAELRKWLGRNRLVAGLGLVVVLALGGGAFEWRRVESRAAHDRLAADVDDMLDRVTILAGQGDFESALLACQTAVAMLEGSEGNTDLVERIGRARIETETLAEAAREIVEQRARVERFLGRLPSLAAPPSWLGAVGDDELRDDAIAAFSEYGVHPLDMEPEAALDLLLEAGSPAVVALALDEWARIERDLDRWDSPLVLRLQELALQLDRDDHRSTIRQAVLDDDRAAIDRLLSSAQSDSWPPATVVALAHARQSLGAIGDDLPLLRECRLRHPDDPIINELLAARLESEIIRPHHEIIRFLTAAQAARPDNTRVSVRLAHHLALVGRLPEALAVATAAGRRDALAFDRLHSLQDEDAFSPEVNDELALALMAGVAQSEPTDDAGRHAVAWALVSHPDPELRDPVRAVTLARDLIASQSDEIGVHNTLGVGLLRQQRWREAIAAIEEGILLRQDVYQEDLLALILALDEQGRRPTARARYRTLVSQGDRLEGSRWNLVDVRAEIVRRFGEE